MNNSETKESDLSFHEPQTLLHQIEPYLVHWKWFVFSLVIFIFVGYCYYKLAEKSYFVEASFILEDEKKSSGELSGLSEIGIGKGIFGSSASFVNDQTLILQSRRIMRKVIEEKGLNIFYFKTGRFQDRELSHGESPVIIQFLDQNKTKFDLSGQ